MTKLSFVFLASALFISSNALASYALDDGGGSASVAHECGHQEGLDKKDQPQEEKEKPVETEGGSCLNCQPTLQ